MSKYEKINNKDIINITNNMSYGSVLISFNEQGGLEIAERAVLLMNKSIKDSYAAIKPDSTIEGFYRVLWGHTTENSPSLNQDELFLEERLGVIMSSGLDAEINVRKALFTYARQTAKELGIKVKENSGVLNVIVTKKQSVSKMLLSAYDDGDSVIEFSDSEINIATLRVYISQLNTFRKCQAKIITSNGCYTVILKDNALEAAKIKIKNLLTESINSIGHYEVESIVNEVLNPGQQQPDKAEVEEKSESQLLIWQEYGFKTEAEYIDYLKDKQNRLDEFDKQESQSNEGLELRLVDGLMQYEIPDFKEPEKPAKDEWDTNEDW